MLDSLFVQTADGGCAHIGAQCNPPLVPDLNCHLIDRVNPPNNCPAGHFRGRSVRTAEGGAVIWHILLRKTHFSSVKRGAVIWKLATGPSRGAVIWAGHFIGRGAVIWEGVYKL